MLVTMLNLGLIQYKNAYVQDGQYQSLLNNIRWATDYFIKAHSSPMPSNSIHLLTISEGSTTLALPPPAVFTPLLAVIEKGRVSAFSYRQRNAETLPFLETKALLSLYVSF